MDRNLYERANDCRWWAPTSAFRQILSKPEVTPDDAQQISDILKYINGLYTVYTNLFVYDRNENAQIVVTRGKSGKVGIIVDRLGEIPEVSRDQINNEHKWWKGDDSYIEAFVKPPEESEWEGLLCVLDPSRFLECRLLARGVSLSNILTAEPEEPVPQDSGEVACVD